MGGDYETNNPGLDMLCRILYAMLDYAGGADVHYGLAAADDDGWPWLHQPRLLRQQRLLTLSWLHKANGRGISKEYY